MASGGRWVGGGCWGGCGRDLGQVASWFWARAAAWVTVISPEGALGADGNENCFLRFPGNFQVEKSPGLHRDSQDSGVGGSRRGQENRRREKGPRTVTKL